MKSTLLLAVVVLFFAGCSPDAPDKRKNDGSVSVTLYADVVKRIVPRELIGFNMSYYHDTDARWADGAVAEKLKSINTGVLRYPGGAETNYYHWQYPGRTGYRDALNPSHTSNPETYRNRGTYMDTDLFVEWCRVIGAEPLLGINLKSGVVRGKESDALQEAVDWVNYCKGKGYNIKYWYLDNELDQNEYTAINITKYASMIKEYSEAMKAVDPSIKIIVNPIGGAHESKFRTLINSVGNYFDIIDIHYYYDWDVANWERWLSQKSMINMYSGQTYAADINGLAAYIKASAHPHIKIASLEWNIAPTKAGALSTYQQAMMQAEMFQQYITADVQMAAIWPLIWNVDAGTFPSILDQKKVLGATPVYETTPVYEVFKLYSDAMGGNLVHTYFSDTRLMGVGITGADKAWAFIINKTGTDIALKAAVRNGGVFSSAKFSIMTSEDRSKNDCVVIEKNAPVHDNTLEIVFPAYTFGRVEFIK